MHSLRLSCLISVTCASAGVCESLLLTCAVCRSASQNQCRECWIVDYINSVGHTALEDVCRRLVGSEITDLVITVYGPCTRQSRSGGCRQRAVRRAAALK